MPIHGLVGAVSADEEDSGTGVLVIDGRYYHPLLLLVHSYTIHPDPPLWIFSQVAEIELSNPLCLKWEAAP